MLSIRLKKFLDSFLHAISGRYGSLTRFGGKSIVLIGRTPIVQKQLSIPFQVSIVRVSLIERSSRAETNPALTDHINLPIQVSIRNFYTRSKFLSAIICLFLRSSYIERSPIETNPARESAARSLFPYKMALPLGLPLFFLLRDLLVLKLTHEKIELIFQHFNSRCHSFSVIVHLPSALITQIERTISA